MNAKGDFKNPCFKHQAAKIRPHFLPPFIFTLLMHFGITVTSHLKLKSFRFVTVAKSSLSQI